MDSLKEVILPASCEIKAITGDPCCSPLCLISQLPPLIDMTDVPVPPNSTAFFLTSPNYYLTAPTDARDQFVYLSNWARVINDESDGVPNFFTWLDAYSPNPAVTGTIRQGSQPIYSLNPYIASTAQDFHILDNIYDSLAQFNPLSNLQSLNWMSVASRFVNNTQLTYTPPPGTVTSYRFNLRGDIPWHDGRMLTAWDVKFSYLTLRSTGAFQALVLGPMTGVTVLGPTQLDINLNTTRWSALLRIASATILPGRYWSGPCPGDTWDHYVSRRNVPDSCMIVDPVKTSPLFDPLSGGILIGSGPWECRSNSGVLGTGCSSNGTQGVPEGGSFLLTRFGEGTVPALSSEGAYFRSSGTLALWLWSGDNGDFTHDFINLATIVRCYGAPVQPLGSISPCAHWQQGIGGILNGQATSVTLNQISIALRFVGANFVSPFSWATSPPTAVGTFPPTLYEGTSTGGQLNPFPAGTQQIMRPASIVGCLSPYPTGGYDC